MDGEHTPRSELALATRLKPDEFGWDKKFKLEAKYRKYELFILYDANNLH